MNQKERDAILKLIIEAITKSKGRIGGIAIEDKPYMRILEDGAYYKVIIAIKKPK